MCARQAVSAIESKKRIARMRIIAIANQKGGCGKTTVALNLSACLAREGRRTLLIDLDPQGHCALGLAVPEEQIENSMADALLNGDGRSDVDLARIAWQISSNFDLAPGKTNLASLETRLADVPNREARLRSVIEKVSDKYDFVMIDSPPTIGFLMLSALHAADEIIVPVDTGYFALHGLAKQLETIREVASRTDRPLKLRILGNLYDVRTKLAREILAELRKRHASEMLSTFVNFNTKLKESTSLGQPITEYDPASIGCRDFVRLAREIIELGETPAVPESIQQEADALAADAERLLATSETLLGANRNGSTMLAEARSAASTAKPPSARPVETVVAPVAAVAEPPRKTTQPFDGAIGSDASIQRKLERIYGIQTTSDGVVFATRALGAHNVRLAGDFNGWNSDVTPLKKTDSDGTFEVRLPLGPGRYRYRYVIDGRWINDPYNAMVESNPFGDLNNIVVVS